LFEAGFLGTRAPFFMDVVTLVVALLPLLVGSAIFLARKKLYKYHAYTQRVIFIVSVIVLTYFETGVRMVSGFEEFMKDSGVSQGYAFFCVNFSYSYCSYNSYSMGDYTFTSSQTSKITKT
jgi:putative membrane protein